MLVLLVFWFRHCGMARLSHNLYILGQPWSHMLTPFSASGIQIVDSRGHLLRLLSSSKETDPSAQLGMH